MRSWCKLSIVALLLGVLSSCKNDDISIPAEAELIFPEKNSECTSGMSISETQSSVTFSWKKAAADMYRLNITNLTTGITENYPTSATSFTVDLLKAEAYSWSVTSISDDLAETAQSEIWSFYNAGDGVVSYAPFPAGVIYPEMGVSISAPGGELTLQWNGADVDNDIATYDLYFDVVNPPVVAVGTSVSSESFEVSGLTAATVYYWSVITRDSEGNTSASAVFEFRTVE